MAHVCKKSFFGIGLINCPLFFNLKFFVGFCLDWRDCNLTFCMDIQVMHRGQVAERIGVLLMSCVQHVGVSRLSVRLSTKKVNGSARLDADE